MCVCVCVLFAWSLRIWLIAFAFCGRELSAIKRCIIHTAKCKPTPVRDFLVFLADPPFIIAYGWLVAYSFPILQNLADPFLHTCLNDRNAEFATSFSKLFFCNKKAFKRLARDHIRRILRCSFGWCNLFLAEWWLEKNVASFLRKKWKIWKFSILWIFFHTKNAMTSIQDTAK